MSLTEILTTWVAESILLLGYPGIGFLMMLESIIFPLPSEIILPFAGYLISQGYFQFWLVVVAATIGSVLGSMLSYEMGKYGGRPFLAKYGKFFLLRPERLKKGEEWFRKHGEGTVFFCRLLPVTRFFISIPAGIARMERKKFFLYTLLGAFIWNLALTYGGVVLGSQWIAIIEHAAVFEITISIILIILIIWYIVQAIDRRTKFMKRIRENKHVKENLKTVQENIDKVTAFGKKQMRAITQSTKKNKK